MLRFVLAWAAIGLLYPGDLGAGENVRLFFSKTATQPRPDQPRHVVREGEWLYKILEDAGFQREEFPRVIPQVRALNPHIEDLDHMRAGQVLYLPRLPKKIASSPPSAPVPVPGTPQKIVSVQPGESLVQILARETGASLAEIYTTLIPQVRQLNPHLTNVDFLRAGERLALPGSPGISPANATGSGTNAALGLPLTQEALAGTEAGSIPPASAPQDPTALSAPEPLVVEPWGATNSTAHSQGSPLERIHHERRRTKQILSALGFVFIPGDEAIFPLHDGSWFAVDLRETPILSTPWGDRVVLVGAPKASSWIAGAKAAGLYPLSVPADWELQQTIKALGAAFPRHLRLWPAGRDFVVPRPGVSVTLRSPLVLFFPGPGKLAALWPRLAQEPPLPQGVREALGALGVTLVETDAAGEVRPVPSLPVEALLLPEASAEFLHHHLDETLPSIRPLASVEQILAILRQQGSLVSKYVTLSWVREELRALHVQIPAWVVGGVSPPVVLLDEASPPIVALLHRAGYVCARMPMR